MVPAHPLTGALLAGALFVTAVGCGGDDGAGGGADTEAFCAAHEELRAEDPFAELDLASPGEMRAAFDDLAEDADDLADAAPARAEVQAGRYRASISELTDQLRGAGFDLTQLDRTAYQQAAQDYEEAAVSIDNAAVSICD